MDRVRLMCWCRSCVSGLHLPAFAAADAGLFAEQGLEVEFVSCVAPSAGSLLGWSEMITAVAAGEAEFALTSVAYLLAGQAAAEGSLAARFAAVFHQRNPIAALVARDSGLREPQDLPGRRLAARGSWYVQELEGAVAELGLAPLKRVEPTQEIVAALASGEVDVIPGWVDMTPSYSKEDREVRAIALELDGYATGLVAADRLALDLVSRMRDALAAGYELQREQPELGIAAFRRRAPGISEQHLRTGWAAFEPYAFGGPEPLSMDSERWRRTIEYTAATHGLSGVPAEQVYRPELLAPALERTLA